MSTVDVIQGPINGQESIKTAEWTRNKLNALITDYIKQNPLSEKAFKRAQKGLPGGTTRAVLDSSPFPISIKSASGATLTSIDGKQYIDFVSDFTAGLYGHSNPVIQNAITAAAANGFSIGAVTELEAELSEMIKDRYPSIDLIRYCNSGTEANMYAIAAALAYTDRKKVLVFDKGYHGGTLNFSAADEPMNLPHDFVLGTFNDIAATDRVISEEVGAILIEPMQSSGGMRPATQEFLRYLRKAADDVGAVLIFDEVVTSRLSFHGLQEDLGVRPDMTTLGKFHGGGLPFGAFGGKREIMAQFDPYTPTPKELHHSGTFNNNIFTMSAAVAAAGIFTKEKVDRINKLGDRLREGIRDVVAAAGAADAMIVLGVGSCVGIGFLGPRGNELREAFYFHHLARGLWFGRRGFACLNFAHQEEDIDKLVESSKQFVQEFF